MQEWEDAKKIYEAVEIPEELHTVVNTCIAKKIKSPLPGPKNWLKWGAGLVAACFCCLVITLNTSEAFAKTMVNIPVVGPLAKILTVRSYTTVDQDKTVSVHVPGIHGEDGFTKQVNAEIEKIVTQHVQEAEQRVAEYKEAFIATGGTGEEFAAKHIKVDVQYRVPYASEEILSLVITANENWTNAYHEQYYYNLDLQKHTFLTLQDVLGEQYVEIANASIRQQMQERMDKDPQASYFTPEMGGFTTVSEQSHFYLNKGGNPVIVFQKYEIAPGSMGVQEFEIKSNTLEE